MKYRFHLSLEVILALVILVACGAAYALAGSTYGFSQTGSSTYGGGITVSMGSCWSNSSDLPGGPFLLPCGGGSNDVYYLSYLTNASPVSTYSTSLVNFANTYNYYDGQPESTSPSCSGGYCEVNPQYFAFDSGFFAQGLFAFGSGSDLIDDYTTSTGDTVCDTAAEQTHLPVSTQYYCVVSAQWIPVSDTYNSTTNTATYPPPSGTITVTVYTSQPSTYSVDTSGQTPVWAPSTPPGGLNGCYYSSDSSGPYTTTDCFLGQSTPMAVAPTATLSANPASIVGGNSSSLSWSSTNATSCTGTNFSTGGAPSGTVIVSPSATTNYSTSCTGAGGTAGASATVTVTAAGNPNIVGGTTSAGSGGTKTIFLTSGSTWQVPSDWNSANNKIEVIGGGGGGGNGASDVSWATGGGGGAYSSVSNVTLTPSATVNVNVGSGGSGAAQSGTAGGDTYFNGTSCSGSTVCAKGGSGANDVTTPTAGGAGGQSSAGVGTTKYSGGAGGPSPAAQDDGAGGGAAGPYGNGAIGGGGPGGEGEGGAGGGGADGGSVGGTYSGTTGGAGGAGANGGGSGGAGGSGVTGSAGAGGGAGTEWGSAGAGGGGGTTGITSGGAYSAEGTGGLYGGGGGLAANGAQGIIVITYTPASTGGIQPNVSAPLSSTVANQGTGAATSFPSIFEISKTSTPANFAALYAVVTAGSQALGVSASGPLSASYSFPTSGTWYVRACGNMNTSGNNVITESNYADNCGGWDTVTVGSPITASCSVSPSSVQTGTPVTWTATASGGSGALTYTWGGNVTGTGTSVQQTYATAGTYNGTITVTDASGDTSGAVACSAGGGGVSGGGASVTAYSCIPALSANPSTINAGAQTTLTWSEPSVCATSCLFSDGHAAGLSGTYQVSPPNPPSGNTDTYSVTCGVPANTNQTMIIVNVPTANITVTPARVAPGGAVTINWNASNVTSCMVTKTVGATTTTIGSGLSGSTTDNPTEQTTYTISCTGSTNASAKAVVNVLPAFQEF